MEFKKGQFVKGLYSGIFYEIASVENHDSSWTLISTKHLTKDQAGSITLNYPRHLIPLSPSDLHELKLTLSGNQLFSCPKR